MCSAYYYGVNKLIGHSISLSFLRLARLASVFITVVHAPPIHNNKVIH